MQCINKKADLDFDMIIKLIIALIVLLIIIGLVFLFKSKSFEALAKIKDIFRFG